MSTIAHDLLIPESSSGIFRTAFLYVGQGETTFLAIPKGSDYIFMLVDCTKDADRGGIDISKLMADALDGQSLDYFVNTHPHADHLSGLSGLLEAGISPSNVWHSGHVPGDKGEEYETLQALIKTMGSSSSRQLQGTRDEEQLGDVTLNVLAPAEYVCDDIAGETPEARDARVHEHCTVLRFGYGDPQVGILVTGDADLDGWKKHITDYHRDRLPSVVLSAPHHGSRSFFMAKEGDEAYLDHLEAISPSYVVVSAPTSKESPHDHPHNDAMELYTERVGEDGVMHLGPKRESVIVDVWPDGELSVTADEGELAKKYGLQPGGDDKGGGKAARSSTSVFVTKIDDKPMG